MNLLSSILPLLDNLSSVQIGRYLDSHERARHMLALTDLYPGHPAYNMKHLSMTDRSPRSDINALSHGFHVLIGALNKSQKQIDNISAGFEPYDKDCRNSIDHIVLNWPADPLLQASLAGLKQLDLVLEIRARTTSVESETYLATLLNLCTNLETLSLSFPDTSCAWLAGLPDVHLPTLTSLTINKAHRVSSVELYDFITRHKTLKVLKLILLQFDESDPFKGLAECLLGLKLNEIHLQQLTTLHKYSKIMLFGSDATKICNACYEDVEAAFHYVRGPGCEHGTLLVKGEHDVYAALESRLQVYALLPRLHPGWQRRFEEV